MRKCVQLKFNLFRMICIALCALFMFTLLACSNNTNENNFNYTDEDDYANFINWQTRYQDEKELVTLLRNYNSAFIEYRTFAEKFADKWDAERTAVTTISFTVNGIAFLSAEHIKSVETYYDSVSAEYVVSITLDETGTKIFADVSSSNVGHEVSISENYNNQISVIFTALIQEAITGGRVSINITKKETANDIYILLASKAVDNTVRLSASAYNDRLAKVETEYPTENYIPTALPTKPPFTDVSTYLKNAEALGL